jgi:hypothetical protein
MKFKSLLTSAFMGVVLNELVLFMVAPFMVTWGAPKSGVLQVVIFFLTTPLRHQFFGAKALFWCVALNGALWGMVGYSLYKLFAHFKARAAAR